SRRAALARLRVVRPIPQLRGARRQIQSLCRRARRWRSQWRARGSEGVIAAVQERFGATLDRLRTYDRPLIVIAAILLGLGILFSMATSPVATARIRIDEAFYFAARQAAYALLGLIVMLGAASLDPRQLRRAAVIIFAVALPLCVLAAVF